MQTYFISDMHFGHEGVIAFGNRPFNSLKHMEESMIEKWNNKVTKNDRVFILGDFSFYDKKTNEGIVRSLNGDKILIKGNHCRSNNIARNFGFTANYYELKLDGRKIVLFHYPIAEFNGYYKDAIHLYGHTHRVIYDIKNAYNVCVEVLDYEPCTLEEVIERNKYKREEIKCL